MKIFTAIIILFFILAACRSEGEAETTFEAIRLSPREAQDICHAQNNVLLLDVRSEAEFETFHLPGAVSLPHDEIETRAADMLPDKDRVIFVYCRAGNRSRVAADLLARMGYSRVYDIGGVNDWITE